MPQPILIRGEVTNPSTYQLAVVEDEGYSFCNCYNIFYTDWKNIDIRIYDEVYHKMFQNNDTKYLFLNYAEKYLPMLSKHKKIKTFCEIGAINNTILECAKDIHNWDTIRLDINPHSVDDRHKIITGNIETPSVVCKLKGTDSFWMSHLVEHLKDPIQTLKNVHDCLSDNGVVFIAMPDPYYIDWNNVYNWGHWHMREHHILWDMESFIHKMKELGFKCLYSHRNMMKNFVCVRDYHLIFQKI